MKKNQFNSTMSLLILIVSFLFISCELIPDSIDDINDQNPEPLIDIGVKGRWQIISQGYIEEWDITNSSIEYKDGSSIDSLETVFKANIEKFTNNGLNGGDSKIAVNGTDLNVGYAVIKFTEVATPGQETTGKYQIFRWGDNSSNNANKDFIIGYKNVGEVSPDNANEVFDSIKEAETGATNRSGHFNFVSSGVGLYPSPYITGVFDYCYGVGQHSQRAKPEDINKFIGSKSDYILLGGWGGYITAGFDHDVINSTGNDFAVFTQPSYGNEQAVIYVMDDTNNNNLPDDTWYELSGSDTDADYSAGEFFTPEGKDPVTIAPDPLNKYIRDYKLTYYKANTNLPDTDPAYDSITWSDNQGNTGILKSVFGAGSSNWWWEHYNNDTEITFTGVKLPNNKYTPDGTFWWDYNDRLNWGYGENYAAYYATDCKTVTFGEDTRKANCLDISNAIDKNGVRKNLEKIRFIRVQTGVFLQAGWLNEISTEVSGAVDLNIKTITVQ